MRRNYYEPRYVPGKRQSYFRSTERFRCGGKENCFLFDAPDIGRELFGVRKNDLRIPHTEMGRGHNPNTQKSWEPRSTQSIHGV